MGLKDLYHVLLGAYLYQCWIVEFKEITGAYHDFLIGFRAPSFTLKITVESLGNRNFPYR